MKTFAYSDKSANGLTRCIIDYITFSGGYGNRINNTGTLRKIDGQMKLTKGMTKKGTADIHALYNGRHISVEVKIAKDRMSEHQHREQKRIEAAGGVYIIARSMPDFLSQWHQINQAHAIP